MINRSMIMMALTAIAAVALPAGASASPHHEHHQDELDMLVNSHHHQKATPLQEKEHHLGRKIDRDNHRDYLERQNEMLLERLQSAEDRLTTAERDINSLQMNYANLETRCGASEVDIKGDNILDDMVALDTASSNDSDVTDKFIGLDMTLSNDMMSIQ